MYRDDLYRHIESQIVYTYRYKEYYPNGDQFNAFAKELKESYQIMKSQQ